MRPNHTPPACSGDTNWSEAVIDPTTHTLSATHVDAGNGTHAPRVEVSDGTDIGVASGTVTIGNVAPTQSAGVRLETVTRSNQPELAAVLAGNFSDPGFTRTAAGTAETFAVTVDRGDETRLTLGHARLQKQRRVHRDRYRWRR